MIDTNLLNQAVEKWGQPFQVLMAIEECGELIAALAQYWRGRDSNVIEEIADVTILMAQLRLIYGPDEVDKTIEQKMERLKNKLEAAGV